MHNITIITQAMTSEVLGDGSRVNGLNYTDRATGEQHGVELAGIFVQIGQVPNTEWLKGVVDLTPRGEIIVDERGQTSVAGIFAAGDVTNTPYKQSIIAMVMMQLNRIESAISMIATRGLCSETGSIASIS